MHSVSGQQELQAKLNRRLAELRASTNFQSLEKDGVSAQWRALDGQMQPTLTRDKWVFTINKELGGVSAWINPAKVDVMRRRTARGILGGISCEENGIMIPANAFKPAGSEIRNGNPSAIFEYTYPAYEGADVIVRPLEGLRITQRWTLLKGDAAELETTLSNPTNASSQPRSGFKITPASDGEWLMPNRSLRSVRSKSAPIPFLPAVRQATFSSAPEETATGRRHAP